MRQLTGEFEYVQVNTVRGYESPVLRGRMRLALNDTLERFYLAGVMGDRIRRGDRLLAGSLVTPPYPGDSVAIDGRTIIVDVRCAFGMCADKSAHHYTIARADAQGFTGWWSYPGGGIGIPRKRWGRRLARQRGYFCARRVAAHG